VTLFDLIVILIVVVSVAISIWRGLVREVLSLVSWIGAFFVAKYAATLVASWLPDWISQPGVRLAVAFVLVMIAAVMLFSLVSIQIAKAVRFTGLQGTDRALGGLFGFIRGVVIAVIAVLVAGLTPLPKEPAWRDAMLSRPLQVAASAIQPWLPPAIRARIKYD
jgi:membrane protein required for colicin V production